VLIVAGLLTAVVPIVSSALPRLIARTDAGLARVGSVLGVPPGQASLESLINQNAAALQTGVLSGAALLSTLGFGLLLALGVLYFLLAEGERIWEWVVGLFPQERRAGVSTAGRSAWRTLAGYIRGVTLVACLETALVALTLVILGVPLVLPLALLTFVGAYFPTLGSVIAGALSALIALVSSGLVAALVVVGLIIVLQILENTLYPRVVNSRAGLHPLATVLVLTAGFMLGGPLGALLSVPLVAVLYTIAGTLRSGPDRPAAAASSTGTGFAP
jgi:predicted PurR-regulated permease PerM